MLRYNIYEFRLPAESLVAAKNWFSLRYNFIVEAMVSLLSSISLLFILK